MFTYCYDGLVILAGIKVRFTGADAPKKVKVKIEGATPPLESQSLKVGRRGDVEWKPDR